MVLIYTVSSILLVHKRVCFMINELMVHSAHLFLLILHQAIITRDRNNKHFFHSNKWTL